MSFISYTTTTHTATEDNLEHVLRAADPITTDPSKLTETHYSPEEDVDLEEEEGAFLTQNCGVTGREPNTNPSDWLTNHRRVPAHRPPFSHPEWVTVGGPLPVRIFLWNMFSGCQLLQWGYSVARATGLHDRGYCIYQVANEW